MYAALLVEAIREIEEENQAMQAQASESSDDGGVMLSGDDRAEYMGWIMDDFPGTAEQVRLAECNHGNVHHLNTIVSDFEQPTHTLFATVIEMFY